MEHPSLAVEGAQNELRRITEFWAAAAVKVVCLHLPFWKVWLSGNASHGAFPEIFLNYPALSQECLLFHESWRRAVGLYLSCDASIFFPWQACLYMREYSKSRDFLARAQCIQPFNRDINNELKKLARWEPSFPSLGKRECLDRL